MNHVRLKLATLILLGLLILSALCWLYVIHIHQQDPCKLPSCWTKPDKPLLKPCQAPCPNPPVDSLPPEMHQGIFLHGEILSDNMIMVNYQTPVGNSPVAHKSWIGLWEGNTIQDRHKPLKWKFIQATENSGTLFLDGLTIEAVDYVVGYGIGKPISACTVASTLSFGGDLPLMTPGVSNASAMEVLESGDNYILFQLHRSNNDGSSCNNPTIAIKYENTYPAVPKQNATNQLAIPDSTQNYYADLKSPAGFRYILPENIVRIDQELFILKDFATRRLEWYTMAHLDIVDGDTSIVSTCTFKVNPPKQLMMN